MTKLFNSNWENCSHVPWPEYYCAVCEVCLLNVESLIVVYRGYHVAAGCMEHMAAPHWGIVLQAALLITRARINIRVSQYKYDSADQIWASSFIHLHTHTVTHCPRPVTVPTWLQPLFIEQRPLLKSLQFVPFILYLPWKTKLKNFYCRTLWDVKS